MNPGQVITSLEEVKPEWLTAVLADSGALSRGAVAAIEVDKGGGNWSTNARIRVEYEERSEGALPQRLFLKMVNVDLEDESFGPSEVTYYTHDYIDVEDAPLIRCYDAQFSEERQRYHVMLDDVSGTHVEASRKAPTLEYGLALAEGLAAMHARWWGEGRLAEAGAPIHSASHIRRFVEIAEPGAGHIIGRFASELKPHWPQAIRDLYAKHPQAIIERTRNASGFALIHGDPNHNNILVPRDGTRPVYLVDRQPFNWSLTTWLGAYDLAYAVVLDWEIPLRRRLEMPVLRHYHQELLKRGIRDYSWERLLDDYRLSAAMGVYVATEYCRGGINEQWTRAWLTMLRRSLTACDDLNCPELW